MKNTLNKLDNLLTKFPTEAELREDGYFGVGEAADIYNLSYNQMYDRLNNLAKTGKVSKVIAISTETRVRAAFYKVL